MNYKHLGKYHHIYRLLIGGDLKAHVEKFPIVYSNKHYIYFTVPGDPELHKSVLDSAGYARDTFDGLDESRIYKIKDHICRCFVDRRYGYYTSIIYYFLLDDPTELQALADDISKHDLIKMYLEGEKKRSKERIDDFEANVRAEKEKLRKIEEQLKNLEESDGVH